MVVAKFGSLQEEEEDKRKKLFPPLPFDFGPKRLLDFLPKPGPIELAPPPSSYTVQPDDNLWNITKSVNGDPDLCPKLYQENKQIIGNNPDLIFPKQNLDLTPILPKLSLGPRLDLLPKKQPLLPLLKGPEDSTPLQPLPTAPTNFLSKLGDTLQDFGKGFLQGGIRSAADGYKQDGLNILYVTQQEALAREKRLGITPLPSGKSYLDPTANSADFGNQYDKLKSQVPYEPNTLSGKAGSVAGSLLGNAPEFALGGAATEKLAQNILGKLAPKLGPKLLPYVERAVKDSLGLAPIGLMESDELGDIPGNVAKNALTGAVLGPAFHGLGQGLKLGKDVARNGGSLKEALAERKLIFPELESTPLKDVQNAFGGPTFRDFKAQQLNNTFLGPQKIMSTEPKMSFAPKPLKDLRFSPLQQNIDNALGLKKPLSPLERSQKQGDLSGTFKGLPNRNTYSLTTGEQRAFNDLQEGIKAAQNYVGHTDVLAGYPPGTSIEQAYGDIAKNTGVDLPKLMGNWERAQATKTSLTPKELGLGRAAGVIPQLKPRTLKPLGTNPFEAPIERVLPKPLAPQTWTNREGIIPGSGGPLPIRSINKDNLGLLPKLQPTQLKNNMGSLLPQGVSRNLHGPGIPSPGPSPLSQSRLPLGPGVGGPLLPGKMSPLGNGQKARSFPISTAQSPFATPELIQGLRSEIAPGKGGAYDPITLSGVDKEAQQMISQSPEAALNFVLNSKEPSALHTATGIRLIKHYQDAGNFEKAVDVSMDLADRLTKHGQAISAARLVGALSPDGILTFASKQINKINSSKLLKGIGQDAKLTPEMAQNLKELAERSTNAIDEKARIEASQELQALLNELKPSGIGRKLAATQTISQLYNPKTQIRNIVGNELFYRLERLNKYPAALIDWTSSKLTGSDRTVTFRTGGQSGYWDGFLKGAKAGWKGVNINGLQTQYDLGRGPAFNRNGNAAEKTMSFLERSMGAVMKGFDNAAYQRAYNQTLGELEFLRAKKTGSSASQGSQMEKNLNDIADQYGKYVTFQDNNLISRALSGVKQALNKPTGGDFGLGDMVLKYPKTPGALIARGLDYSPAGFLRSAYLIAKPLLQGGLTDQREVVLSLSRAITGTAGLTGLGYFLADKGIITGDTTKDYDLRALQKQVGEGPFRVNISALRRWVFSGLDSNQAHSQQGDTMISYDWAAPISMAISMGANMNKAVTERENPKAALGMLPATIAGGLEGAANTIAEQPVLQGLSRLFQGYDMGSNLTNTLKDIPGSFTPTLLNQIRQASDNSSRITSDQSPLKEAFNRSMNKIPGLEKTLPQAYDTFGKPKEIYQNGSNNLVNVFLNPAFISHRNLTPESKMVLDIFSKTGETKQVPRVVSDNFVLSGKKVTLTPPELSRFQQLVGARTSRGFASLNPSNDPDRLINDMVNILNKATADAKATILQEKGIPFKKSGNTLKASGTSTSKTNWLK